MTMYNLIINNNSSNRVDFCLFQTPPDLGLIDVKPLAWFAEAAYPTTKVAFQWNELYSFVWSNSGPLSPGVTFVASQVWDADPTDPAQQAVQLLYGNGAYTFSRLPAASSRYPGNLYIEEGGDVPLRDASVGIGMSGSPTFAVDAQPNQHLIFEPHPEYWLVAGNFQQGQVLDWAQVSNAFMIEYIGAGTTMKVNYNMDNTFSLA